MDGSLVFSAKIIAASWPRKWCSRLLLLTVKWNVRWMQIKLTMTVWQSIVCQGSRCWFHLIVGVAQDLLFQKFRADQMQASLKSAPRGDTTSSTSWASALTPHTSAQVVEICWADVHTDLLILVNIHDETKWHTCTTLSYTKRSRYGDRTYEYTSARTMTVVHQHQLELCTTMSKVFGVKMYVVRFMTSIHVQKLGQQLHRRFWPYIHRFHQGNDEICQELFWWADLTTPWLSYWHTSTSRPGQTWSSLLKNEVVRETKSEDAAKRTGVGYGRYLVNELDATC